VKNENRINCVRLKSQFILVVGKGTNINVDKILGTFLGIM
jgi:hypothetical protein